MQMTIANNAQRTQPPPNNQIPTDVCPLLKFPIPRTITVTTGTMQVHHPNGWEQSCSRQCNTLTFSVRQKTDNKSIFYVSIPLQQSSLLIIQVTIPLPCLTTNLSAKMPMPDVQHHSAVSDHVRLTSAIVYMRMTNTTPPMLLFDLQHPILL